MATHLDPTLQAGLTADAPLAFFALEIDYPAFTLRLLDGAGVVEVNGHDFLGEDPVYGSLNGPDSWQDGVSAEAPHLTFQLNVLSNDAAAALCAPGAQGSTVSLYFGAVNRATGATVGTPLLIWQGDLDVTSWLVDRGTRIVKVDAESSWDRFFDVDQGILLTNASHQQFWPGELGLEYVTEVQSQIPWGQDLSRPVVVHDVPGGSPEYSNSGGSPYVGGGGASPSGFGGGNGFNFNIRPF